MSYEYPRAKRITRSSEFRTILQKGRRVRALDLDVRVLDSPLQCVRVGIIVPRHGRTAIARNRLKRQLRELSRTLLLPASGSANIVIRCRPSAYEQSFDRLRQQVVVIQGSLKMADSSGSDA